jgi:hypothetical protein
LAVITGVCLIRFLSLIDTNFLIQSHFYSVRPTAVLVLAYSLHKLAFPWMYLALALGFLSVGYSSRTNSERRELIVTITWLVLALCPYIFLIYDIHVPSRHLYLAAMPGCYLIAQLVRPVAKRRLRWGFVAAFAIANMSYLWFAKDPQYVKRGRTIHDLVAILNTQSPGCALVEDFPENPWIAKLSARFAPGWSPEMINVNEPRTSHVDCTIVKWDSKQKKYEIIDD